MNSDCLLNWHIKSISQLFPELGENDVLKIARENTICQCKCFPSFPNLDLITSISGQKYEKLDCYSNMAFLPKEYVGKVNLDVEYNNPIILCTSKIRTVRKILESVGSNSCLVFQLNSEGHHEAIGTASLKEVSSKLVTLIEIHGHMVWRAYISNWPIFEYKNGDYFPINEKYNKGNLEQSLYYAFEKTLQKEEKSKNIISKWIKIISNVAESKHGTSIVILSENYDSEVERLTEPKAGHGIKLKQAIDFSTLDDVDKLLSQITRIDGGLLINIKCQCYAIGCIFDGIVFDEFEGDSGRGSRYNSVKLYVQLMKHHGFECMGIVISDDGTVDIIC